MTAAAVSGSLSCGVKVVWLQLATGGLALVVTTIRLFGWSGIVMALEEILEVFQGLRIKVTVTIMNVIIDKFHGEGINEQHFGFFIIKFLFIATIQEFNSL